MSRHERYFYGTEINDELQFVLRLSLSRINRIEDLRKSSRQAMRRQNFIQAEFSSDAVTWLSLANDITALLANSHSAPVGEEYDVFELIAPDRIPLADPAQQESRLVLLRDGFCYRTFLHTDTHDYAETPLFPYDWLRQVARSLR